MCQILNDSGGEITEERLLVVVVKKGWKNGTKLSFPNEGDQEVGTTKPGD